MCIEGPAIPDRILPFSIHEEFIRRHGTADGRLLTARRSLPQTLSEKAPAIRRLPAPFILIGKTLKFRPGK